MYKLKVTVLDYVTSCSLGGICLHLGAPRCFHLQGTRESRALVNWYGHRGKKYRVRKPELINRSSLILSFRYSLFLFLKSSTHVIKNKCSKCEFESYHTPLGT
jgi:hypothetical protein